MIKIREAAIGLHPGRTEAGCDEAGRGCLAGPVFAAAVILPPDFRHPLLNDSKQVSEKQRNTLRVVIEKEALAWAVAQVSPEEIDRINILKASFLAMHRAIGQLALRPAPPAHRRQPLHPLRRHPPLLHGEGRRAVYAHCGGLHPGKNLP
jgi:ribonuclease HII